MRPAGHLLDLSRGVQLGPAAVGVGLQRALEAAQVRLRMYAAPVGRVGEPGGPGRGIAGRPVVAHVHPQPSGAGLAGARRQHLHRRVAAVDLVGCQRVASDGLDQRVDEFVALGHPARQRRAVQFHARASEDAAQAVQGLVVAVLGDHHVRHQRCARQSSGNGPARRGSLEDALAADAGELGADVAHDLEAAGHVLQLLRDVAADRRTRHIRRTGRRRRDGRPSSRDGERAPGGAGERADCGRWTGCWPRATSPPRSASSPGFHPVLHPPAACLAGSERGRRSVRSSCRTPSGCAVPVAASTSAPSA